jgi:hypothetical protein
MDTFAAFSAELGDVFSELIAKGFSSNQALALLAPTLLQIQKAAAEGRITIDASTQALIDQANAGGLLDNIKDPMAEMVEIQKLMLEATAALVKAFGADLPASVQKYIAAINQIPGIPAIPAAVTGGPAEDGGGGPPQLAGGGYVHSSGLAYLHAGETVEPAGDVTGGPAPGTGPVPFDEGGGGGHGGGGGVVGGPAGGPTAIEKVIEQIAKKVATQRPVNVQPLIQVDASTTPAAFQQQFIEQVADKVGKTFQVGGRNYRDIQRAVRSANSQG